MLASLFGLTCSIYEIDVTLGLIGDPDPALRQISKHPGFGIVLRYCHQTKAFC
jgi:hypothetical protein